MLKRIMPMGMLFLLLWAGGASEASVNAIVSLPQTHANATAPALASLTVGEIMDGKWEETPAEAPKSRFRLRNLWPNRHKVEAENRAKNKGKQGDNTQPTDTLTQDAVTG